MDTVSVPEHLPERYVAPASTSCTVRHAWHPWSTVSTAVVSSHVVTLLYSPASHWPTHGVHCMSVVALQTLCMRPAAPHRILHFWHVRSFDARHGPVSNSSAAHVLHALHAVGTLLSVRLSPTRYCPTGHCRHVIAPTTTGSAAL